MSSHDVSRISDVITVVGSAYQQPIADLLDKLLKRPPPAANPAGTNMRENGYSAALIILLVAMLESYTSRLRFVRRSESIGGNLSTPELLTKYFPALPTEKELFEVFLVRNVLSHNHIWHLDVTNFADSGSLTLATPPELGFNTNKHYEHIVDTPARRTVNLKLNVDPTAVDRFDRAEGIRCRMVHAQVYENTTSRVYCRLSRQVPPIRRYSPGNYHDGLKSR